MPCIPFRDYGGRPGFLCVPNEPIEIQHGGKVYLFEWTGASGWMALNKDGSQQHPPRAPRAVWDKLDKLPRPE